MRLATTLGLLALCLWGLTGCGSGEKATLTPEQEKFVKNSESTLSGLKDSVDKAATDMQKSTDAETKKLGDQLQTILKDAMDKLNALRLKEGGTWEQKKAAVESVLKDLQVKLTEAMTKIKLPAGLPKM